MRRLLLLSSSRTHGTGFLEHASGAIRQRLGNISSVLFIPYALADRDGYATLARGSFSTLGYGLKSIHESSDPRQAVAAAESIFIGGGNTFRLLKTLYDHQLVSAIRARVLDDGIPYIGSSAGTNMACPTIRTTNDMPIVEPPSFAALRLVPFQINPHYLDADPDSMHQGETRDAHLAEYLEENESPVIGLREGSWLMIDGDRCELGGSPGGVLFHHDAERELLTPSGTFDLSTFC